MREGGFDEFGDGYQLWPDLATNASSLWHLFDLMKGTVPSTTKWVLFLLFLWRWRVLWWLTRFLCCSSHSRKSVFEESLLSLSESSVRSGRVGSRPHFGTPPGQALSSAGLSDHSSARRGRNFLIRSCLRRVFVQSGHWDVSWSVRCLSSRSTWHASPYASLWGWLVGCLEVLKGPFSLGAYNHCVEL